MSITVGSSTITVNGGAVMADPPGSAGLFFARAWVNFNGTGTVAIRGSGNVNYITDVNVGDYEIHYLTTMTDGNYSIAGSVTASGGNAYVVCPDIAAAYAAGYVRIQVSTGGGTTSDRASVNVIVIR